MIVLRSLSDSPQAQRGYRPTTIYFNARLHCDDPPAPWGITGPPTAAPLAQTPFNLLCLMVLQGLHHLVIGVDEGRHDDFALRRVGLTLGRPPGPKPRIKAARNIGVACAALSDRNLHTRAVVDQGQNRRSVIGLDADGHRHKHAAHHARQGAPKPLVPLALKVTDGFME